jgi:hypothetical protein
VPTNPEANLMATSLVLPQGDHDLTEPAVGWLARFVDAQPPAVELIAEIQSPPRQTSFQNRGQTATSLAIQMDARVAIDLYRRIAALARSMGWQLPP